MMASTWQDWPPDVLAALRRGGGIPAHQLARDGPRKLDVRRQCALARYYLDAGAGGLAVGVHTPQFALREVGLYRPVFEMAMQTVADWTTKNTVMSAGLAGRTTQAVSEAGIACGG